ncbi:MAG: radical SAM-associated putative lipoprotein [Bacteroidales bacterium]|nr:radical SAM-associated putative lipoprotein [Bacteroidales bacterium]
MAAKLRHLYEIIAGAILSLLGITGSVKTSPATLPRDNFGASQASYKIVGRVMSENGEPLQGIRVRYSRLEFTDENGRKQFFEREENEFLTDKNGNVNAPAYDYTTEPREVKIELDGMKVRPMVLSGKDIDIRFTRDTGSSWHLGNYTIAFSATMKQA